MRTPVDYSGEQCAPTAQQLADVIARLKQELGNARQVVADSEARVAELEQQLVRRLDEEIAELEQLRPKTGDGQEPSKQEEPV
jgi:phage shock protein A